MRFAILGPLEVRGDGEPLPLGGPQQRALLAVLLLNAGRVVSTERLVEYLWGEQQPPAARSLLQGCVAGLRRSLQRGSDRGGSDRGGSEPGRQRLVTRAPGYCLEVAPDELDLDRFERLASAAGLAAAERSRAAWERSAALFGEALALWRGPALDGVMPDAFQADVARLEERRLAVLEQRVDVELRLGRHANLVGELAALVRAHPLRERLWAQLMLAQYGADRQADALASYQLLRRTLVAQLGVEPSATLRRLHAEILSGVDPQLDTGQLDAGPAEADPEPDRGPTERVVPAQLPPAVAAFTGRDEQLKHLDALLAESDGAAAIGVISGTAGVGKTALAVHWAHRAREWFGDGQLYVNLHGYAQVPPMRPLEALAGFLQALGTPAERVPVEPDRAAALYRTLLADKRVLVVLDNAYSAEQVRPLLPGSSGCVVVITSRDRLGGLVARDGARHLTLDVLSSHEAVVLLGRVLGAQRVQAEPDESAELADRCGRLPLALRIAAANLAYQPRRRIADQVVELVAGDRLSQLAIAGDEESAVRAAFDLSYDALDEPARLLFRRLGLVPGPDVAAPAAAALAGTSRAEAGRLLEQLARAHLVYSEVYSDARADGAGRYALHDLLRLYAAECARREETVEDRAAAIGRLCAWYLSTADAAARHLYPTAVRLPIPEDAAPTAAPDVVFADHVAALAWLDGEVANLVATIQYAAEQGPRPVAWLLADTLRGYFMLRVLPVEWAVAAQAALAAAEADDDPRAEMAAELSLAGSHLRQNRYEPAVEHYRRALALSGRADWPEGDSAALGNLGTVYLSTGRLAEAADHFGRALEVDRRIGWLGGQAVKLGNLGVVDKQLGRLTAAADHLREALALFRQVGSHHGEALGMANLGAVLHQLGRYPEAIDHVSRAAELHREIGDRGTEADDQNLLAEVYRDTGRLTEALDLAEAALARAVEVGERYYEANALNIIGSVYLRLGDHALAEDHHRRGLEVARRTDTRLPEGNALVGLAEARRRLGDPESARCHAEQAAELGKSTGHRVLEGQALVVLANAFVDLGRRPAAAEAARRAAAIQRDTGYRLGEEQALAALERVTDPNDHGDPKGS